MFKKSTFDLIRDEEGVGAVEYAVLGAIGVAASLVLGVAIDTGVDNAATSITSGTGIAMPTGPVFTD